MKRLRTRYDAPEAAQSEDQSRKERADAALEAGGRPDGRQLSHEEAPD